MEAEFSGIEVLNTPLPDLLEAQLSPVETTTAAQPAGNHNIFEQIASAGIWPFKFAGGAWSWGCTLGVGTDGTLLDTPLYSASTSSVRLFAASSAYLLLMQCVVLSIEFISPVRRQKY